MIDEEKWITGAKNAHNLALELELEQIKSVRLDEGVLIYNPDNNKEFVEMSYPEDYELGV